MAEQYGLKNAAAVQNKLTIAQRRGLALSDPWRLTERGETVLREATTSSKEVLA